MKATFYISLKWVRFVSEFLALVYFVVSRSNSSSKSIIMSLQIRLAIIFAIVITIQVVLTMVVQETVVTPSFVALEKKEAAKNLDRVMESIQRERKHISLLSSDWAAWEDAYEFIQHPSPEFIASNLNPESLAGIRINMMYFYDLQGKLVWGKYLNDTKKEYVPWPDLPEHIDASLKTLITHKDPTDAHIELLMSSTGPMMLATRPIVHTGFKGPIKGTLMMGRLLDKELIQELVEQTHVSFQIFPRGVDGRFSGAYQAIVEKLAAGESSLWREEDADHRVGYALVTDHYQNPGLLIRAETPREITHEGSSAYWGTLVSNLIQGVSMLGILLVTLHRLVIRPLTNLNVRIAHVATHGDLTSRTGVHSSDEIGLLARQFDTMVVNLAEIVGKIHLHAHSLDASVQSLGVSKEGLQNGATTTRSLAMETISSYQELQNNIETVRHSVTVTRQEVVGMACATRSLGENLQSISQATSQASGQIDTMENAAMEITGHVDGVRENLGQVEHAIFSISQAVSDLSMSLAEVRTQTGTAATESEQARLHADTAGKVTQKLSSSATSIGNVVDIINNIAEQTNMLALNASIEAAGAGSAGAGFSVVADEVKVLAQKTAKATEMISERILDIQDISRENGRAIEAVTSSINRIYSGNQMIAQAVELQNNRLGDIAKAMAGVTQASGEVQSRVSELGNSALHVTESVHNAAQENREIARSVEDASMGANMLVEQGKTLDETARQMDDATTRGEHVALMARERLDAITCQIHHLSGMVHHMAGLVATTASPGHRLLEASSTLSIGPSPFDVSAIKRQTIKHFSAIETARWEACGESQCDVSALLDQFDREVLQEVLRICESLDGRRGQIQEFLAQLRQCCMGADNADPQVFLESLLVKQKYFFRMLDEYYLQLYLHQTDGTS